MVEDFIIYVGKRQLKKDAVPSIFDFPEHLLKKKKKENIVKGSQQFLYLSLCQTFRQTHRQTQLLQHLQLLHAMKPKRHQQLEELEINILVILMRNI